MNNKVLVMVKVPELDENFDVYLPINRKIGSIIKILIKAITELLDVPLGKEGDITSIYLYDGISGDKYDVNQLLKNTNIRNSSQLILL